MTSPFLEINERPNVATSGPRLPWPLSWVSNFYFDKRGIGSRPKLLFTVAALDAVLIMLAGYLADSLVGGGNGGFADVGLWGFFIAFVTIGVLHRVWSYSIPALRRLTGQIAKVSSALGTVFLAVSGFIYLTGQNAPSAGLITAWFGFSSLALLLLRVMGARVIGALTKSGQLTRRTVIVGGGQVADDLIAAVNKDDDAHLQVLGVFDDRQGERATMTQHVLNLSGTFEDLGDFCLREGVDLVIVTVPPRAEERLLQVLQKLFSIPVDVRISAHNARLRFSPGAYSYIGLIPMLAVMDKPLNDWDRALKGIEDRVLGAVLTIIALPIMAFVALAVRLDSKGPIMFKQRRYGFNNELIEVYKFRSMYVEQSDPTADKLVTRGDPRVTRVGRFIRRTSLDELPQLFNVLKGQMSLVGPRPHATRAKAGQDLYEDVVTEYFARHRVKPGVTGWAQINGWRGETDTPEKIERRVACDLEYIDRWSLLFDFYIIVMTPIALLSGKNAY